uniref:Uncharacterized protein n=1 Tax=Oryza meridionalis TaxID=40149 RepID=A0A0E0EN05_9ORYZ
MQLSHFVGSKFCQLLRAGETSADLERDPGGDPEECLGDLRLMGCCGPRDFQNPAPSVLHIPS